MNPAEEIVKFWLQNAGYFYQSSIRLPHNKEIDILSIDEHGNKNHIEICVPVRMANYTENAQQMAQGFYDRKFLSIEHEVKNRIGENYEKKLVMGNVSYKNKDITLEFIEECKKLNIEVILFKNILNEVRPLLGTNSQLNAVIKAVQLTEVFGK